MKYIIAAAVIAIFALLYFTRHMDTNPNGGEGPASMYNSYIVGTAIGDGMTCITTSYPHMIDRNMHPLFVTTCSKVHE